MQATLGALNPQSFVFSMRDDFVGQLARDISGGALSDAAAKLLDYYSIMNSKFLAAQSARQLNQSQLKALSIRHYGNYSGVRYDEYNRPYVAFPAFTFDANSWLTGYPEITDLKNGAGVITALPSAPGPWPDNYRLYPSGNMSLISWYTGDYSGQDFQNLAERYDQLRAVEDAFDSRRQAVTLVRTAALAGDTGVLSAYAALPRTLADDFYTVTEDPLNPLTLAPIVVINPLSQKSETSVPLAPVQQVVVNTAGQAVVDTSGNAVVVKDTAGNAVLTQPFSSASGLSKIFLPAFEFVTKADATGVAAKPAGAATLPLIAAAAAGLYLAFK